MTDSHNSPTQLPIATTWGPPHQQQGGWAYQQDHAEAPNPLSRDNTGYFGLPSPPTPFLDWAASLWSTRASTGELTLSGDRFCSYKEQIRVLLQTLLLRACLILYSFRISDDPAGCNCNAVKKSVKSAHMRTHTHAHAYAYRVKNVVSYERVRYSTSSEFRVIPGGWNWNIVKTSVKTTHTRVQNVVSYERVRYSSFLGFRVLPAGSIWNIVKRSVTPPPLTHTHTHARARARARVC